MIVPFGHVLIVAGALFLIGAACVAARRNFVMILVGVEIMLNGAGLAFVGASLKWGRLDGQIFVIFLMAVAAAEVAVGLGLIVSARRRTGSMDADDYDLLKD